jgi:hypothetical protein
MRPIVWLASYPRSGNTYLRALLANYLHGADEPLSINALQTYTLGEDSWRTWREATGLGPEDLDLDRSWAGRSSYYERVRARVGEGPLLVKTHTLNGIYQGVPAFEFRPGDRVIHVVRHPCDVAVSTADFNGIDLDEAIDRLLQDGLFVDGRPRAGVELLGSWDQHTRNWLNEGRIPVQTFRFFDLVERPEESLGAMLGFMELASDPARISRAVDFTRFDSLRAQEERSGFAEGSPRASSGRFFRDGRSSQWLEVLSPEQAERLIQPNQARLDQLGFTDYVRSHSA